MTFESFSALAIVGAFVSVFVQFVKSSTYLTPAKLKLLVIVMSLASGLGYWYVKDSNLLPAALTVLGFANTVFLFFIKPFENSDPVNRIDI
jgi:hypothetical protein